MVLPVFKDAQVAENFLLSEISKPSTNPLQFLKDSLESGIFSLTEKGLFAKAKAAKILREMIMTQVVNLPESSQIVSEMCELCLDYCSEESVIPRDEYRLKNSNFLRHRISIIYCDSLIQSKRYIDCQNFLATFLTEIRKLDDKALLVELYILESTLYFALQNMYKCKASLTCAKTNSNAVFVGGITQAKIDLLSGMVSVLEEDYSTAYSYFYEAVESICSKLEQRIQEGVVPISSTDIVNNCTYHILYKFGLRSFSYLILAQILGGQKSCSEVENTLHGNKYADRFLGNDIIGFLTAISKAFLSKSLAEFEKSFSQYYNKHCDPDEFIKKQLIDLRRTLIEENISEIIRPYSDIYLSKIARKMNLSEKVIEGTIAEMILDQKMSGRIENVQNNLLLHLDSEVEQSERSQDSEYYKEIISSIDELGLIVDELYSRVD